jgi:hypothetical protein
MALQEDGRILIGGAITTVDGTPRKNLARLENDAAIQKLTVASASRIEWLRGGSSFEAQDVAFDFSTDAGKTWTFLGSGARIPGGWELTGLSLPANCRVRARARVVAGNYFGFSSLIEAVASFSSVNVNLPRGDAFVLVANPLNLGTDTLNEILPNAPINTTKVYSFDSLLGGFQVYTKRSTGWQPADGAVFPPGKGFFVQNTSLSPITLTFIGLVPEGTKTNYIRPGFNLLGPQFLLAGRIETDFHLPAHNGDRIYQFKTNSQSYVIYMREPTGWNPSEPVIGFAEGFFLETTNAAIWTNSYSVPR